MKAARGVGALALVGVLVVLVSGPSKATSTSAVRSDGGMVASGIVTRAGGGGTASFLLVVPTGGVVASDPGSVFARPWVAVAITDAEGREVCRTVANPTVVSGGTRHRNPDRVDGIGVEAVCGDTVYSAHWRDRGSWLKAHPLQAVGGGKTFSATAGGHSAITTVWPSEQQTSTLEVCERHGNGHRVCDAGKRIGDVVLSTTGILTVGT